MKKISIFFMIILMMLSCFSCAKKDTEEAFIAADEGESETIDNKKPTDNTAKPDSNETKPQENENTQTESTPTKPQDTQQPEQPQDTQQPEQNIESEIKQPSETEPIIKHKYSDVFKEDTMHDMPLSVYGYSEVCMGYGEITVDNINYERRFYEPRQFPFNSQDYNSIDFNKLQLSDKKAQLKYYIPNEMDGFVFSGQVDTVQLYELPEKLKSNQYIDVIAVKLTSGENRLFYHYKDFENFGDFLDMFTIHFGHKRSSADDIKSIYFDFSSEDMGITNKKITVTDKELVECLLTSMKSFKKADPNNSSKSRFKVSGSVTFEDNTSISFFSTSSSEIIINGFVGNDQFSQILIEIMKK